VPTSSSIIREDQTRSRTRVACGGVIIIRKFLVLGTDPSKPDAYVPVVRKISRVLQFIGICLLAAWHSFPLRKPPVPPTPATSFFSQFCVEILALVFGGECLCES
jgi:hypothetical protein